MERSLCSLVLLVRVLLCGRMLLVSGCVLVAFLAGRGHFVVRLELLLVDRRRLLLALACLLFRLLCLFLLLRLL